MGLISILADQPGTKIETLTAPDFFVDLNLDQLIDAITAGKPDYDLKPFFYTPLHAVDGVHYRHEVLRDLENHTLLEVIESFAQKMQAMRDHLTQVARLHYRLQKESWFLDAVEIYFDAVSVLLQDLSGMDLYSRGFLALRTYLYTYTQSAPFTALVAETRQLKTDLSSVEYSIVIKGNSFRVCRYEVRPDYSVEIEKTFEKFKRGAVKDYRVELAERIEMNHVEEKVLEFVALLHPELFARLDHFYQKNGDYLDETIKNFDREVQFYVAYLEYMERFKSTGLKFCYPQVSNPGKTIFSYHGFDLALAHKLLHTGSPVICNDFFLAGEERIIIVSGPNQGGKTTFARTFGQLHYLASLGLPVPGSRARLYLFDQLFTHFEKAEHIGNLHGKLQDELIRITTILNRATPESIIIMNEIFTSTALEDAIFLSQKVLEKIIDLDLLCICVTFIDELSTFSPKTVSMVSTVAPDNTTMRTFKIVRKPADGLSYALSIADKYQLTYRALKERLHS
ncbi:MAG: DNA mismatch repair protein MutS [Chloroflexi bacterium]|nr:DNA mismatch repair protein MutS [Chloroflexota bacterium]